MRPEDLAKIKQLVQNSQILSSVERAEWMQLLSQMNDKQVLELSRILTPAPAAPAAPKPQGPVPSKAQAPANLPIGQQANLRKLSAQVNFKQKEISTPRPFYEPEIAAPKPQGLPQPAAPQQQQQAQQQRPSPADPAELQKRVASIVHEMDQRKSGIVPVPRPSANVDLQQLLESDPKNAPSTPQLPSALAASQTEPEPKPVVQQLDLRTATDFAKLTPAYLENKNLNEVFTDLMNAIRTISQRESIYDIINNFESSPLQAAYVNLGAALLNDSSDNRLQAYENAEKALQQDGKPSLNKEEFEFLTDFRGQLQQLY